MSKYLIGFGALLLVIVLVSLLLFTKANDETVVTQKVDRVADPTESAEPSLSKAKEKERIAPPMALKGREDSHTISAKSDKAEKQKEKKEIDIERALESMRASVNNLDPRTPEMSQPYQRELPTEEELADPALYEAYELRQTKKVASIYSAVTKEIPSVRNRIDAAKLSGEKSEAEIQEAEEALSKLEQLSEMLQMEHPELQQDLEEEFPEVSEESYQDQ